MTWETESTPPTDNQIELMIDLCDKLHYDYEELAPGTFEEAKELIDALMEEAKRE